MRLPLLTTSCVLSCVARGASVRKIEAAVTSSATTGQNVGGPPVIPAAPAIEEPSDECSAEKRAAALGFVQTTERISGHDCYQPDAAAVGETAEVVEVKFEADSDAWVVCVRNSSDALQHSWSTSFCSYEAASLFCAELKLLVLTGKSRAHLA